MTVLSWMLIFAMAATMGAGGAMPAAGNTVSTPPAVVRPVTDAPAPAPRYEGPGFDTAQEALTCYVEGLKALDFEKMLSAFAWETQLSCYDINAYFKRIRAYFPTAKPRIPSVNDFMLTVNLHELRSAQIDMIYNSLEAYILDSDFPAGKTVPFREESDVDAFLQKFYNGRLEKLSSMSNIRFVSPDTVTGNRFSSEQVQKNYKKQMACYGADETVNIAVIASVGDETLFCCPTVARYGDRWYLVSVSSVTNSIIGLDMNHQAFACGKGSLEDILK